MPKKERGLPDGFGIAVPDEPVKRTPVKLDDYLEREIGGGATLAVVPERHPHIGQRADDLDPVRAVAAKPLQSLPHKPAPTFPQRFRPLPATVKMPRVQINLTPEVQRMVQELVAHFCMFGLQKDTSASEVFDALLTALHEARDQLDLSNVPPRGPWGKPTARAFRTNLKSAVIDAIARHRQRLIE